MALEGTAGAGKTPALAAVRDAAEREGYQVEGFAPTSRAAHKLAEVGIESNTLQRHLARDEDSCTRIRNGSTCSMNPAWPARHRCTRSSAVSDRRTACCSAETCGSTKRWMPADRINSSKTLVSTPRDSMRSCGRKTTS